MNVVNEEYASRGNPLIPYNVYFGESRVAPFGVPFGAPGAPGGSVLQKNVVNEDYESRLVD